MKYARPLLTNTSLIRRLEEFRTKRENVPCRFETRQCGLDILREERTGFEYDLDSLPEAPVVDIDAVESRSSILHGGIWTELTEDGFTRPT